MRALSGTPILSEGASSAPCPSIRRSFRLSCSSRRAAASLCRIRCRPRTCLSPLIPFRRLQDWRLWNASSCWGIRNIFWVSIWKAVSTDWRICRTSQLSHRISLRTGNARTHGLSRVSRKRVWVGRLLWGMCPLGCLQTGWCGFL